MFDTFLHSFFVFCSGNPRACLCVCVCMYVHVCVCAQMRRSPSITMKRVEERKKRESKGNERIMNTREMAGEGDKRGVFVYLSLSQEGGEGRQEETC